LTLKDGREWLEELLDVCTYHGYSVALEFDHYSWYQDLTYHILKRYNAALVWSDIIAQRHHLVVTGDFLYLRMAENNENRWIKKIKYEDRNKADKELAFAVIIVGKPAKANVVLKLLGMPEKKYGHTQWIGRIIMCVDLNAFFPACEELRDQSLIGKPHAVIMTEQKKDKITRGAVASCSYEARKFGVRSAMSLAKAKELCPQLILNPVDMDYYRQISDKVIGILEEYADVLEQTSIDEAYLDCINKKSTNPSISIEEYATQIKKSIKEQCGLLTSIGVATTKSVAKIASDFQKPDGLTIIYPDKLQEFLGQLKVSSIAGIGVKTEQILKNEMGIETIGQLAKYDVQKLVDRFGKKNGLWMWQVANGQDRDPVVPREDNISLSSEQTLDYPTKDRQKILQYLNKLVDEVYDRVSRKGYEFRTVGVKLVRSDFSIETRETSYSNYQNKKESIVYVIESLVERFALSSSSDDSSRAVRKVGIKISNLVRAEKKKPLQQKTMLDYI
jgi:DNA polymerase IV (archaeal DinB-like DNA polymerase)